jgi:hypothetical protein
LRFAHASDHPKVACIVQLCKTIDHEGTSVVASITAERGRRAVRRVQSGACAIVIVAAVFVNIRAERTAATTGRRRRAVRIR